MSAPKQALMKTNGLQIKEKASAIEAITALLGAEVEMANKYQIFDEDGNDQLFYAAEKTDCCKRQMKSCFPDCSPWELDIAYTQGGRSDLAYTIERPCTFTFCCFNRPEAEVTDVQSGEKIGTIKDPCACCDLTFQIKDANDEVAMNVRGGCCQWGLCCPLPCGPCSHVHFDVEDAAGNSIGGLEKQVPGCCKFLFASDVDNYKIDFSDVSDPSHRALLMALGIFIDFRYFSDNKNDNGGAAE